MAVALVVGLAVWYFSRWYHRRFLKLEEKADKLDKLPCVKHDEMFASIKEDLAVIRTYITTKYPTAAPVFSQKMSPRRLNEAGEKLLADIGGLAFLDTNKGILISCIEERKPKTALDVEESALLVLYDHLDDDMFIGMKQWVYNSPSRRLKIDGEERDYTVTMNDVCFVLSLPLRDMYLDLHHDVQ